MFRHTAKVTQQFLRLSTPDFIAADEWTSYSPELNPLFYCIWDILQDLVYDPRDDFYLQIYRTWKRQSKKTNGRRSPFRQFENQLHNGKINECGYKAEWRRYSAHFPLIAVTGYWSHAWDVLNLLVILYVSDTYYYCVFHCQSKTV